MELENRQVRVAIVGAPCTGKTCIVKRFTENTFHGSQYCPTPGVDFFSRRMTIKTLGTVTLVIVDISGAAMTSKMLSIYLHNIDIYILTYDMTNMQSLNDLRKWLDVITMLPGDKSDLSLALAGAKGDLEHLRAVRLDNHTRFAHEFNIPLSFLVSAKSGESVQTCFTKCAIYHLSPEAKQRVRDHAIIQATVPKRQSVAPHPHPPHPPVAKPLPGGQGEPSTVCMIQ